jgi:WD40 repeat protein
LPAYATGDSNYATAVAFSPDSQLLAVGDSNGRIEVFDLVARSRNALLEVPSSRYSITALAFALDGDLVIAAISTDTGPAVRIWDWRTGQELRTLGHSTLVTDIALNADTRRLYTLSLPDEIRVWEVSSGAERARGGIQAGGFERALTALAPVGCASRPSRPGRLDGWRLRWLGNQG